nr:hypothetical protein CFP56_36255 [Quercus suber]
MKNYCWRVGGPDLTTVELSASRPIISRNSHGPFPFSARSSFEIQRQCTRSAHSPRWATECVSLRSISPSPKHCLVLSFSPTRARHSQVTTPGPSKVELDQNAGGVGRQRHLPNIDIWRQNFHGQRTLCKHSTVYFSTLPLQRNSSKSDTASSTTATRRAGLSWAQE